MREEDVHDVARTVREKIRTGAACELLYTDDVPPLRLVFTPIDSVLSVGEWTRVTGLVESAFPSEMRDASLDDATLVSWLGVGAALLHLAGDAPVPLLSELRILFPAASVSGLAALGRLVYTICVDPFAAAKEEERRALAAVTRIQLRRPFGPSSLIVDGEHVRISRSLQIANHSPTGFAWGYGGSGPAQTALAILLHVTDDENVALRHHQAFKFEVIGGLSQNEDHQLDIDVRGWIEEREAASVA